MDGQIYRLNINELNFKKMAFTLAEILITLGIIGVVAAITIPTLMNNVADIQTKSILKKTFAVLSQATTQIGTDNGGTLLGAFTNAVTTRNLYANQFKTLKTCTSTNASGQGCWSDTFYLMNDTSTSVLGNYDNGNTAALVMNNGVFVIFGSTSTPDCTENWYMSASPAIVCAIAVVDVNGIKQPNTMGKDIFQFYITQKGLIPSGSSVLNPVAGDACSTSGSGASCTYEKLYN